VTRTPHYDRQNTKAGVSLWTSHLAHSSDWRYSNQLLAAPAQRDTDTHQDRRVRTHVNSDGDNTATGEAWKDYVERRLHVGVVDIGARRDHFIDSLIKKKKNRSGSGTLGVLFWSWGGQATRLR